MDSPEWRMRILKMNLIDNYLEELQLYENVKCKYFMFNLKQAKKDYDGMMKQHKANCKKDWDPFKRAKAYQHCIKQIPSYAKSKLKMAERMAQKVKQHCSNKVSEAEGMQGLPKGWKHSSVKKFAKSLTGKQGTQKGFFDKCVEKMKSHMSNPEAYCASIKDELHGSTYWRGKGKSEKQAKQASKSHQNVKVD